MPSSGLYPFRKCNRRGQTRIGIPERENSPVCIGDCPDQAQSEAVTGGAARSFKPNETLLDPLAFGLRDPGAVVRD